jgi:hypothetical protein
VEQVPSDETKKNNQQQKQIDMDISFFLSPSFVMQTLAARALLSC